MLDEILLTTLQEVALEGAQGCALDRVWELSTLPDGIQLDDAYRQHLWQLLLQEPVLAFYTLKQVDNEQVAEPFPLHTVGKKPSARVDWFRFPPAHPLLASVLESNHSWRADLRVAASTEFRLNTLGIYSIGSIDLTSDTLTLLEAVGKSRHQGVLQAQLATDFNVHTRVAFYSLRLLEAAGAVAIREVFVTDPRRMQANSTAVPGYHTNLVHLTAFVEHAAPLPVFRSVERRAQSVHKAEAGPPSDEVEVYAVGSVDRPVQDAISLVAAAAGQEMREGDLKRALGYMGAQAQHREWRRVKTKLLSGGYIEEFFARSERATIACFRLRAQYAPTTASSDNIPDDDDPGDFLAETTGSGLVAELSLLEQLFNTVKASGSQGIVVTDLFKRLGLNYKRTFRHITELQKRFNVQRSMESQGKQTVYRLFVPSESQLQTSTKCTAIAQPPELKGPAEEARALASGQPAPSSAMHMLVSDQTSLQVLEQPAVTEVAAGSRRARPAKPKMANHVTMLRSTLLAEEMVTYADACAMMAILEPGKAPIKAVPKTVDRVIGQLVQEGVCKLGRVTLVGVKSLSFRVLLSRTATRPESELLAAAASRLREKRTGISENRRIAMADPNLPSAPPRIGIDKTQTILLPSLTTALLAEQGFIFAKMVRTRMLHYFLVQHVVGLLHGTVGSKDGTRLRQSSASGVAGLDKQNTTERSNQPAATSLPHEFELEGLLEAMPLELVAQALGIHFPVPDFVRRCTAGMRVGDLPATDRNQICYNAQILGRVVTAMHTLNRMQLVRTLIAPRVRHVRSVPKATGRYHLQVQALVEMPGTLSFALAQNVQPEEDGRVARSFSFATVADVDTYWHAMEFVFRELPPHEARTFFPASAVPEMISPKSWCTDSAASISQRAAMADLFRKQQLEKPLTLERRETLAAELGCSAEQLLRFTYEQRRVQRLQALRLQVSSVVQYTGKQTGSVAKRPAAAFQEAGHVQAYKRQRLAKEAAAAAEVAAAAAAAKEKVPDKDSQQEEDVDDFDETPATGCSLIQPIRKERRRARHVWLPEDDKMLLRAYAKWHAVHGSGVSTDWANIEGLPHRFTPDLCRRRFVVMRRNPHRSEATDRSIALLIAYEVNQLQQQRAAERTTHQRPMALPGQTSLVQANRKLAAAARTHLDHLTEGDMSADQAHDPLEPTEVQVEAALEACTQQQHYFEGNRATSIRRRPVVYQKVQAPQGEDRRRQQEEHAVQRGHVAHNEQALREKIPSTVLSCVADLIRLLLLHTGTDGRVPPVLAAAFQRFTEREVAAGFQLLRRQGFVSKQKKSSGRRFALSLRFKASCQVPRFPRALGLEASLCLSCLTDVRKMNDEWSVPEHPCGGDVACVLAMAADHHVELRMKLGDYAAKPATTAADRYRESLNDAPRNEWLDDVEQAVAEVPLAVLRQMHPAAPVDSPAAVMLAIDGDAGTSTPALLAVAPSAGHMHEASNAVGHSAQVVSQAEESLPQNASDGDACIDVEPAGEQHLPRKQRLHGRKRQLVGTEAAKPSKRQATHVVTASVAINAATAAFQDAESPSAQATSCHAVQDKHAEERPVLTAVPQANQQATASERSDNVLRAIIEHLHPQLNETRVDSCHKAISSHGEAGATVDELISSVTTSEAEPVSQSVIQDCIAALETAQLIYAVDALHEARYVADVHCRRLTLPMKEVVSADKASTVQRVTGRRPMRAWLTADGQSVDEEFVQALERRAVGFALRMPGIPEEAMLDALSVVSVNSARELLRSMVDAGQLHEQLLVSAAAAPPRIFARNPAPNATVLRCYVAPPIGILTV
eukprot:jgi/Chlat1/8381/Chrsp80S07827